MLRATTMCPRTQFRQLPAPGGCTRLSSLVTSSRLRLMAPKLNSYMFAISLPVMIELSCPRIVQRPFTLHAGCSKFCAPQVLLARYDHLFVNALEGRRTDANLSAIGIIERGHHEDHQPEKQCGKDGHPKVHFQAL